MYSIMDSSMNIVELIENNPITKLSSVYNGKFLSKIKESFNEFEQQLFVSSFYCYLNNDPNNDYVIDLDDVWKWLGFQQKINAKTLLEKQFILDKDYTKSLLLQQKQTTHIKGGHNKETFMLNVKTFKSFCLKAGTKKADEIHEYYMKLEEMLHDVVREESDELKLQLESVNASLESVNSKLNGHVLQTEKEKAKLREKTILEQFPPNTQCVYYGIVNNVSDANERLIKFGNSNNLRTRVLQHRDTYDNFRLTNAFKVGNKLEIESAIKNNVILGERLRTIAIKSKNYVELLNVDGLTLCDLDNIIQEIIKSIECTPENYKRIVEENKVLKQKIFEKGNMDNSNRVTILSIENKRLTRENKSLTKKYIKIEKTTAFWKATFAAKGASFTFDDNELQIDDDLSEDEEVQTHIERPLKQQDGKYHLGPHTYDSLSGTRQQVWDEIAFKTSGGLTKKDLIVNARGKIVSLRKCITETNNNNFEQINLLKAKH